jgi:hypothetical protein
MTLPTSFKEFFLALDLAGAKIELQHKKSTTIKTYFGSTVSMGIIVFVIYSIFYFGLDIVRKQEPISRFYKDFVQSSRIYLKDYPIKINLSKGVGVAVSDVGKYISMQGTFFKEGVDGEDVFSFDSLIIELCKDEFFNEEVKQYFHLGGDYFFKNSFCVNPFKYVASNGTVVNEDIYIQNQFSTDNSASVIVGLYPCVNSTANNNSCYPQEVQNDMVGELNIAIVTLDSYVNLNNYTAPSHYYLNTFLSKLTHTLKKLQFLTVKETLITTDNGIIMQDLNPSKTYQIDSFRTDVSDEIFYYQFIVGGSNLTDNYFRSYVKIQNIIANIGGLFQFLLIVTTYILNYIAKRNLDFEIINTIYKIRNDSNGNNLQLSKINNTNTNTNTNHVLKSVTIQPSGLKVMSFRNNTMNSTIRGENIKSSIKDYFGVCFCNRSKRYDAKTYKLFLSIAQSKFEIIEIIKGLTHVESLLAVLSSEQKVRVIDKPIICPKLEKVVYGYNAEPVMNVASEV